MKVDLHRLQNGVTVKELSLGERRIVFVPEDVTNKIPLTEHQRLLREGYTVAVYSQAGSMISAVSVYSGNKQRNYRTGVDFAREELGLQYPQLLGLDALILG